MMPTLSRLASLPRLLSFAGLVFGVIIIIQISALIWFLLTPAGPFGAKTLRSVSHGSEPGMAETNILARFDPFVNAAEMGSEAAGAGGIVLYGTRTSLFGVPGSAIISVNGGPQSTIGVGEQIAPGVSLIAVAPDHVVIEQAGVRQKLGFVDTVAVIGAPVPSTAEGQAVSVSKEGDPVGR